MKNSNNNISPKIEQLIETARELFSRYGIKRVSVEEICRKAEVSKMTFYRSFANKTAIVKYILKELYSETRKKRDDILSLNIPFEEKIQKILIMKLEMSNRYSREFISEVITGAVPELKEYIEKENRSSHNELRKIFTEAQKNGDIRPDININFVMYMTEVMRETFKDKNLLKLYPDIGSAVKDAFNFFYYGILTRRKKRAPRKNGRGVKRCYK